MPIVCISNKNYRYTKENIEKIYN